MKIPEMYDICNKVRKSEVYKEAVSKRMNISLDEYPKTPLDQYSEMADNYYRKNVHRGILSMMQPNNPVEDLKFESSINVDSSEEMKAYYRIVSLQQGYSICKKDGKLCRSEKPILYDKDRRTVSINSMVEAATKTVKIGKAVCNTVRSAMIHNDIKEGERSDER